MSETEKQLRAHMNRAPQALKMLDAFLAEHRAEVEALRDELTRANQSWANARDAATADAARDALGEISTMAEDKALRDLDPTDANSLGKMRRVLDAIHARARAAYVQVPKPAARRYVDAEKVRDAMLAIADMDDPDTRRLLTAIAARFGVDLDAAENTPSFCRRPECGHQWHTGPCVAAECICSAPWPPIRPSNKEST